MSDEMKELAEEVAHLSVAVHELAADIMEATAPGFIIVASPQMARNEEGMLFPLAVAVNVNADSLVTKQDMAYILEAIAENIKAHTDDDIEKILELEETPND